MSSRGEGTPDPPRIGVRSTAPTRRAEPSPRFAVRPDGTGWWRPERVLARVAEPARPLAEAMQGRLFLDEPPPDPEPLPASLEPATAWTAVEALREGIHEAAERGAPPASLRTLHARLDREARHLAERLRRGALAESRRFLQDVSHDIRSPLNSILFLADTLYGEHSGPLNEVQRRQVGVLYTAAVALVGLVNDLIDAGRLGEGRAITVSRAPFRVRDVAADAQSLLGPLAEHRGVELRLRLEPSASGTREGDRQLLARILINLVTNAIHACDEGGRVDVRVTEPREGWLRAEVGDDGPGADVERLKAYLTDDAAGYPKRRNAGWTHGLGLTICARLARAASGDLRVESEVGAGTRFVADLPFPAA